MANVYKQTGRGTTRHGHVTETTNHTLSYNFNRTLCRGQFGDEQLIKWSVNCASCKLTEQLRV